MLHFEKYEKNPVNTTGAHVQVKKKKTMKPASCKLQCIFWFQKITFSIHDIAFSLPPKISKSAG